MSDFFLTKNIYKIKFVKPKKKRQITLSNDYRPRKTNELPKGREKITVIINKGLEKKKNYQITNTYRTFLC